MYMKMIFKEVKFRKGCGINLAININPSLVFLVVVNNFRLDCVLRRLKGNPIIQ